MTAAESPPKWTFEAGELPGWAAAQPKSALPTFDFGIGIPAVTPEPVWPLVGRAILLRLAVAIGFPVMISIGGHLDKSGGWGEMAVGSCLFGFLAGLVIYLWRMSSRSKAVRLGPLHPWPLPPAPSVYVLFIPPVALPAILIFARWFYLAFENRFVGVAFASLACLAAFYYLGERPIRFMQELILANISVPATERRTRPRISGRPDLAKLGVVLLVVLLVPAYLSNFWGIVAVLALCIAEFRRSITPLMQYGNLQIVLGALWIRASKTASEYLDYSASDTYHWRPPEPLSQRRATLIALVGTFDLALLTGLSYYCPWEPFAAIFVPDFSSSFLLIPDHALNDYRWLAAPFQFANQAQPKAAYLVCFVIAIALYLLIPVLVLCLIYVEQLAELETMAQELKRSQPSPLV
jgi:hypothetical protein